MVKTVLDEAGIQGRLAVITGGWEEREDEVDDLDSHVGRTTLNLRLHGRLQELLAGDEPFSQALLDRNDRLRLAQTFYRRRLGSALASARALHRMSVARMDLLVAERADALRAISDLDDHYLTQIRGIHDAFLDLWDPSVRPGSIALREQIAAELADCEAVLIAGGHVGALLDQLFLLQLRPLLSGKPIVAWSAGAMAVTQQIVLFHDSPPQGQSDPELYDDGLGLAPGIVALPHATARLKLEDEQRVAIFAGRFAHATCVTLEEGCGVRWDGSSWAPIGEPEQLSFDGRVIPLEAS
jgi:hypothetical protein